MPKFRPLSETKFINDANLVAYYPLNGNSNDAKGTNNGTDTSVSYVTGKFGQGASPSATNGNIACGFAAPTSNWTYSFWVNPSSFTSQNGLFTGWAGSPSSQRNLFIYTQTTTGKITIDIPYIAGNVVTASSALSTGSFTMVTVTRSGNTWSIYYNGTLNATASNASSQESTSSTILINNQALSEKLNGVLDDFAVFSKALSASEVNELYQGMTYGEYLGDCNNQFELQNTDLINDSSLLSYWRMEGNSNDSKGSNNGTDTSVTYSTGKFGQCANFVKANSSRIVYGNIFRLVDYTTMSFCFWYKSTSSGVDDCILSNYSQGSGGGFSIDQRADNKIHFTTWNSSGGNAGEAISSVTVNDGNWHLITCVKTSSTTATVYVDGVAGSSGNIVPYATTDGAFIIGGEPRVYGYSDCSVDDFGVFSKALSASEIQSMYHIGSTKLLLHLNGNSTDSSGNGNNGTDTNITYVDGKFGKCASFRSGYDSYINIPNLNIGTSDFTINFIVKPENFVNGNHYYFSANSSGAPYNEFRVIQYPTNSAGIRITHYNGSTDVALEVNSSKISTTQFNYVTITRVSDTLSIYVNGKLENSGTGWGGRNCSGGHKQMIGKINDATYGDAFYGLMDEVVVENRAWSAQEVAKYYTYSKGYYSTL